MSADNLGDYIWNQIKLLANLNKKIEGPFDHRPPTYHRPPVIRKPCAFGTCWFRVISETQRQSTIIRNLSVTKQMMPFYLNLSNSLMVTQIRFKVWKFLSFESKASQGEANFKPSLVNWEWISLNLLRRFFL